MTAADGGKGAVVKATSDKEDTVFGESEKTAPNRIIVMDDLMTNAFNVRDNDATMTLLMTKLSHHNNISVLIVCHELYPKGNNSILFQDQLTEVHLHSIANQQKAKRYVDSYLTDDKERKHYDQLFNEHSLCINDSLKGNRRGSILIKFTLSPYQHSTRRRIGRFLTFNEHDFSVVHETPK